MKGFIEVFIASLLFAFIPIIVRFDDGLGVYYLTFFRTFFAALFLGIFFIFAKRKLVPLKYEKGKLIFFGAIHGFIILGYFIAIKFLSIASAVLLLYSASIWMILFSYFILGEKINRRTLFALVVSIVGVVFVMSPQNFFIFESLVGSVAGLLGGIGFGLVYILSKKIGRAHV